MENKQAFKDFRQSLNLTQIEIAEKLGVSQGTITDIERGRIRVSKRVAKKLNEVFGNGTSALFGKNAVENNEKMHPSDARSNARNDVPLPTAFWTDYKKGFLTSNTIDNQRNVTINTEHLDDIIKNQIFLLDFYGRDILYRLYNLEGSRDSVRKLSSRLKGIDKYIEQHTGNPFSGKRPVYTELDVNQKVELIKELTESTRVILDTIWVLNRDVYNSTEDKA